MLMADMCEAARSGRMADTVAVNGLFLSEAERSLSLSRQSVRNCVCALKKGGLILSDVRCRGVYYLNPRFVIVGMRSDMVDIIKYLQSIGIDIQH